MQRLSIAAAFALLALSVAGPDATYAQRSPLRVTTLGVAEQGVIWGKDSDYLTARGTSVGCALGDARIGQESDGVKSAVYRYYLRFILAGIPPEATIHAARLEGSVIADQSGEDFTAEVYRVAWQSGLCTFREFNYDEPGISGVLEAGWFDTVTGPGHYAVEVDHDYLAGSGVVRYAVRSSRDVGAIPPAGAEWVDMLPAPTLVVTWTP